MSTYPRHYLKNYKTETDDSMESEFVFCYRDWATAAYDSLAILKNYSNFGKTQTIEFKIGPPNRGRFWVKIVSDGHPVLKFPIYDSHPPFRHIRDWMERSGEYLANGEKAPQSLGINCIDYNITMTIIHIGFHRFRENGEYLHGPVSLFMIHRSKEDIMVFRCICRTDELQSNLYEAMLDAFDRYEDIFNDRKHWSICCPDFVGLPATAIMSRELHTKKFREF